jgi:Lysyl oxidase/Secretion system C-terminal sorting domain
MKHFFLFLAFICCIATQHANAQAPNCLDSEILVTITINTDNWGYESSWQLLDAESSAVIASSPAGVQYPNNSTIIEYVCVPAGTCFIYKMIDSYGDGMTTGSFTVEANGVVSTVNGIDFSSTFFVPVACSAGGTCIDPITAVDGLDTVSGNYDWYVFVPDSSGNYEISTCGLTTCNTNITVYQNCDYNNITSGISGALAYSDGGCGDQALVSLSMGAGVTYYIRIAADDALCADPIVWAITYAGQTSGCTDPMACNYNPIAVIEDGSCVAWGSLECPEAPDLMILQNVIENTMSTSTINNNDECLVNEGCLHGYGIRELIRFTTHIKNIGDADYYIGIPSPTNDQFTFDNCHGHWHYEGYAEYLLFDDQGVSQPTGYKNGFCVLDLECGDGGNGQYHCGNMGISHQCGDIYDDYLECQWVDMTGIADGDYTLVVRVNWDNAPDYFGRVETDSLNNWAQVCFNINRSSGDLVMSINPVCETLVGCDGVQYSDAQPDCAGICDGPAVRGDIDANGGLAAPDVLMYLDQALPAGAAATMCTDLNEDEDISMYDAAMANGCLLYGDSYNVPGLGLKNFCKFPAGIENPIDKVWFNILGSGNDAQGNYIEVGVQNPYKDHIGFNFSLEGIKITDVLLNTPASYAANVVFDDSTVVLLSLVDSVVTKSSLNVFQPMARVYYTNPTGVPICVTGLEAVNKSYERSTIMNDLASTEACITVIGTEDLFFDYRMQAVPNPMRDRSELRFYNPGTSALTLDVFDITGRLVLQQTGITDNKTTIMRGQLPAGVYTARLSGADGISTLRIVVE